jgi:hypothetical protein
MADCAVSARPHARAAEIVLEIGARTGQQMDEARELELEEDRKSVV